MPLRKDIWKPSQHLSDKLCPPLDSRPHPTPIRKGLVQERWDTETGRDGNTERGQTSKKPRSKFELRRVVWRQRLPLIMSHRVTPPHLRPLSHRSCVCAATSSWPSGLGETHGTANGPVTLLVNDRWHYGRGERSSSSGRGSSPEPRGVPPLQPKRCIVVFRLIDTRCRVCRVPWVLNRSSAGV